MHYKFIVDSDRENRVQSEQHKSATYGGLASLSIDEEIDATLPAP